jgi:DDE superfamily endonuclease
VAEIDEQSIARMEDVLELCHFTWVSRSRTAAEFAQSIRKLVESYPLARTIHLVVDNLNIHCKKSLTDRWEDELGAALWHRLTVHHTPKHGSWLNQTEIRSVSTTASVSAIAAFLISPNSSGSPLPGTAASTGIGF